MKDQKGMEAKNIAAILTKKGKVSIDIDGEETNIDSDDLEIRITEKEGFSGSSFAEGDLFLNLELTEELIQEGFIRDLIRRIQSMRKDLELVYDAEIVVHLTKMDNKAKDVIINFSDLIKEEVLASELKFTSVKKGFKKDWSIQDPEGSTISINVNIIS